MNLKEFLVSVIKERIDPSYKNVKWANQEEYLYSFNGEGLYFTLPPVQFGSHSVEEYKEKYQEYNNKNKDLNEASRKANQLEVFDLSFPVSIEFVYENTRGLITYPQIKSLVDFFGTEGIDVQGKGSDWGDPDGGTTGHEDYFTLMIKDYDKHSLITKFHEKLTQLLTHDCGKYQKKVEHNLQLVEDFLNKNKPQKLIKNTLAKV